MYLCLGLGSKGKDLFILYFYFFYICTYIHILLYCSYVVLVGLLLLMSLLCRAKNLSPPTMRDSVVQFYNMKSLIVGCWNDLTSTHKLPFALVFGGSTHLRVHSKRHILKSSRSNSRGSSWPRHLPRWRIQGMQR